MIKEFKVNNLISLRLEDKKTVLYVNNREFKQCKYLLFNIPEEEIKDVQETSSIDEVAEIFDNSMEYDKMGILPEEEFIAHCSNLQAWVENLYNTDLLHRNLAFPLLKALSEEGDIFARQRFREEIARRYRYGNLTVQTFLFEESYLSYLSDEHIVSGILDPKEAIFMEKAMNSGESYAILPYFEILRDIDPPKNKIFMSLDDGGKIEELEILLNKNLNRIPKEIENLTALHRLNIYINVGHARNIFEEAFRIPSVKFLTIICNSNIIIPDSFHYFPNLIYLRIRGSEPYNRPTMSFEDSFKKLTDLEELYLYFVKLKKIPNSIINLKKLNHLSLSKTTLKTLPVSLMCDLRSLRIFELKFNSDLEIQKVEIEELEKNIKQFKYLLEF
jgi:hypothetical protein